MSRISNRARSEYMKGKRVRALIGTPERQGTIIRYWYPFAQFRVRWDDGHETNIDAKDVAAPLAES